MLLDRIYRKVKNFVNTDVDGSVTPVEFESALHNAIQERNEEYFFEDSRLKNKQDRGLINGGLANIPDRFREKILFYSKETDSLLISGENVGLPEDYRYLDIPETPDGVAYEFCEDRRAFNILKNTASNKYPIFTISGNNLKLFPNPESNSISLTYLRKIKYPKWTYNVIEGAEVFNPDSPDFEDADIHPSEEDEIVRRVLMSFGVTLKTEDIVAYTMNKSQTEFNQNNAS